MNEIEERHKSEDTESVVDVIVSNCLLPNGVVNQNATYFNVKSWNIVNQ